MEDEIINTLLLLIIFVNDLTDALEDLTVLLANDVKMATRTQKTSCHRFLTTA